MKRLLLSLMVIGLVVGVAVGATRALFTDTETSTGNTITTGTIDIAVNDENPWSEVYTFNDIKPSQVHEITFTVKNVGSNPLKLWKHLRDVVTDENGVNEPECEAYSGVWMGDHCDGGQVKNDIDTVIDYDLYVADYAVIHEDEGITISDIASHYLYLAELAPGAEVVVKQSYHMRTDTGNWAQSDSMSFAIELYAEQTVGGAMGPATTTLIMDNKDGQWQRIADGTYGLLSFNTSGSTFDWSFVGGGLQPSTNYTLIYYADPWPGNNPGATIGSVVTDASGNANTNGSVDLVMDLPDPADANYSAGGAKIWLVLSTDWDGSKMVGWHQLEYLYEERLIQYDDTDL